MNSTLTHRLASFASAALLTAVMLMGVNALAVSDAPASLMVKTGTSQAPA
jgi:hypothetical protein